MARKVKGITGLIRNGLPQVNYYNKINRIIHAKIKGRATVNHILDNRINHSYVKKAKGKKLSRKN